MKKLCGKKELLSPLALLRALLLAMTMTVTAFANSEPEPHGLAAPEEIEKYGLTASISFDDEEGGTNVDTATQGTTVTLNATRKINGD